MLHTDHDKLRNDIVKLTGKHGGTREALIPILQDIQGKYQNVPDLAMQILADQLGIHPVEVHSVASFYHFFSTRPLGTFTIRLCRTCSCMMGGAEAVARQLENDLGIATGETTPDGRFTLLRGNCLGQCDQGVTMLINDQVRTGVTPEKVHAILEECRQVFSPAAAMGREVHLG